jgi:aminoglycoside phosphotransferase (APT) family kinase protein
MIAIDTAPDNFRAELRDALARHFGDDSVDIAAFSRRGEGYSWETYLVTANRRAPDGTRCEARYAVKREPRAGLLAPYDVLREVDLLQTARDVVGIPVPGIVTFSAGTREQRGFYVMEMVDGVVPMPWDVKKVVALESDRCKLGLELAGMLARLHNVNPAELTIHGMGPVPRGAQAGLIEVDKWHAIYMECKTVHLPVLDLAFAWLRARADGVSGRIALVHNDLRVGNVIVKDGAVAAVLDWETAEFSDPAADLAKFNLPTFRGRSSLASGLVEWERFLDTYEGVAGWRPGADALAYWSVMEIAKTIVGALRGVHFFSSRKTDDIRYANMGFQIHHSVRWLVELYENGQWGH